MLNVFLLRHGETPWNAEGNKYCGRTDLPITQTGVKQAEKVKEQLKEQAFDAIYSSPLKRAYDTAKIVGGQQKVNKDDRLIEADFGIWEGKTKQEFIPENRSLWDNWMADPATTQAGDTGETGQAIIDRVDSFFKEAIKGHQQGTILVVAHNGVNRLYLAHKLGMPLGNYRKIIQENSAVSLFSLDKKGELRLHRLNSKK